jgi:hypothetical protein
MNLLKAAVFLVVFMFCHNLNGQNLIGYKEKEIRQYMREKQKNMSFQSMTFNNTFKYMKYVDMNETQTLLFFLTADSVCKSVRLICDKSLKEDKIKELDAVYSKAGNNAWSEARNGKKYLIELKEEEWSFNVTYSLNL